MPAPTLILDPATLDMTNVVADQEAILRTNPHRGHMVQLTAVVYLDKKEHIIAGYKDVAADEFWTAGHFPSYPLFPGVLQCEAAAQLLSYYATLNEVCPKALLGLGGLDEVRFRGPVRPGDRLVIIAKGRRVDRRQTIFDAQGFVKNQMVFQCRVMGVPIAGLDNVQPTAVKTA